MSEADVNTAVLVLFVIFLLVLVLRHGKRIDDERNPRPLPKDKTLFCHNGHAIPFPFSREKGTWCYRCEGEEPVFKLPKSPPPGPHDEGPFR